jgi:hypothetical protein
MKRLTVLDKAQGRQLQDTGHVNTTIVYQDENNPKRRIFIKVLRLKHRWKIWYPKKYRSCNSGESVWSIIADVLMIEKIQCSVFHYKNIGSWK